MYLYNTWRGLHLPARKKPTHKNCKELWQYWFFCSHWFTYVGVSPKLLGLEEFCFWIPTFLILTTCRADPTKLEQSWNMFKLYRLVPLDLVPELGCHWSCYKTLSFLKPIVPLAGGWKKGWVRTWLQLSGWVPLPMYLELHFHFHSLNNSPGLSDVVL